ncbi:hypothetical protein P153DRAFT_432445 [Dothidotthia symphoricarpi CBS 119687]|uniref:Uncharacterized protein n=1 Tax=Dothidotthia symphoricarpi CBS 119687 TaxID=1392245 RepID=A0A6A6A8Z6_9PLEO|nr:uncharacterized protein P153DRAFT_432445 [Dothidotthia symphoricarpi CBS 119687]KAF2128036.1 hypothetical protein P153DRAFT_432445 [Dothidotthia symphoricarpi CBS 119687]
MTDELAPPRKSVELEDPGARELVEESSDEHFSDASEGRAGQIRRSDATSPIPITRVERVDDEPSHGEVPGTDAYQKRTQDAVPDEVEIIPDGLRSRSTSRVSMSDRPLTPGGADRPLTPGGTPIPKTVVERIDDEPSHGEVPGTLAHQLRLADAEPDVIVKVPQPTARKSQGSPTSSDRSPVIPDDPEDADEFGFNEPEPPGNADDDDGFGDFDEFEEGGEGDDDFGDFDDGFQQGEEAETSFDGSPDQPPVPAPSPGLPVLDFDQLSSIEHSITATQPYIDEIYPSLRDIPSISATAEDTRSTFLSERSRSLWTQLVAPPPLQPPDWVRSRIRRLFLVSLGVPVDLDEILPASKQKKLILPSISISSEKSPRPSADGRNPLGRVKKENASSTSVDSSNSKTERKRKGPPAPPDFDVSSTTMLCATTDAALQNFTVEELQAHVEKLKGLQERANEVFEYWQKRLESALGDKDAFEQVIESLVAHAKKLR